ncbi:ylr168c-like protein [Rozella allomycis CSF55]|uniref:Ylr168c-like protein n=1 Tax=Rozella allomycis (strain CSF55) TaxID=988480 RepID=A0A4P9YP54_ROZAC|nr:ylr168c-like protein [Rozella allomycis CSF55]
MKFVSDEYAFNAPWEIVTAATWRKYPSKITPHVVQSDYLDRYTDPKDHIFMSERILTCQSSVPFFLRAFVPSEFAYVREVSKVDPLNKLHVVTSTNLSMSNILAFEEKCTYIPHPSDRNKTKMIQEYRFQFTGLSILGTKLEEFIVNRFRMNAFKVKTNNIYDRGGLPLSRF